MPQAAAKTNDLAGDGTTTATILAAAMIAEGMKIVAAGANPVQLIRGIEKTVEFLVGELRKISTEVTDGELKDVATVSAGGNENIGQLISDAMARVGRQGVVTMEESKTAEDSLHVVEGMQFDRGYISPYFVTDPERMVGAWWAGGLAGGGFRVGVQRRIGWLAGCRVGAGLAGAWQLGTGWVLHIRSAHDAVDEPGGWSLVRRPLRWHPLPSILARTFPALLPSAVHPSPPAAPFPPGLRV